MASRTDSASKPRLRIRWAPRLSPRILERLYDADARGLRDEALCDEVGARLFARCEAFLRVGNREVECPQCRRVFVVAREGRSDCPERGCRWGTDFAAYHQSVGNSYAFPGRAGDAFGRFHRRYPGARTYRDKILLIDELIHAFHIDEATSLAVKSVASKLLEGNKNDVVAFLDQLSAVDPQTKESWRTTAARTIHRRIIGSSEDDGS